jgi:hypothetical protein
MPLCFLFQFTEGGLPAEDAAGDARALWNGDLHRYAGWASSAVGCYIGGAVAEGCRCRRRVVGGGLRGHLTGNANPAVRGLVLPFDDEAETGGRRLELQRDMWIGSGCVLGFGSGGARAQA